MLVGLGLGVRVDGDQGLVPLATDDNPCSCNFWPLAGWRTLPLAARFMNFCSCLLIIAWQNKLPGDLETEKSLSS